MKTKRGRQLLLSSKGLCLEENFAA
jgi:hypothetical protein